MLRNVLIKPVLNGWIIEVGCQKVVFGNMDSMLSTLKEYLENPEGTERWFRERAVNAKWMLGQDEVLIRETDGVFVSDAEEEERRPSPLRRG